MLQDKFLTFEYIDYSVRCILRCCIAKTDSCTDVCCIHVLRYHSVCWLALLFKSWLLVMRMVQFVVELHSPPTIVSNRLVVLGRWNVTVELSIYAGRHAFCYVAIFSLLPVNVSISVMVYVAVTLLSLLHLETSTSFAPFRIHFRLVLLNGAYESTSVMSSFHNVNTHTHTAGLSMYVWLPALVVK